MKNTSKSIPTVEFTYDEYSQLDKLPSRYFIRNSLGNYIFFKTTSRIKANETLVELYGKQYTLRTI